MTKQHYLKHKGRRDKGGFIKIRHDIYDHPAWEALSPKARCIYLEIVRRYYGYNNGKMSLSLREAAEVAHSSKATAQTALKQLVAHGFIRQNNKGHFRNRHATTWIITSESMDDKTPTNDWRSWEAQK